MKIFANILLTTIALMPWVTADPVTAAGDTSLLRKKKSNDDNKGGTSWVGALVSLDGISHEAGETWDMDIIPDTLVHAYNKVAGSKGAWVAESGFIQRAYELPEDGKEGALYERNQEGALLSTSVNATGGSGDIHYLRRRWWNLYWIWLAYGCRFCIDDDPPMMASVEVASQISSKKFRKSLEGELFQELHDSGSKPLEKLSKCSIQAFVDSKGPPTSMVEQDAAGRDDGAAE